MLDLHILAAIQTEWKTLATDKPKWRAILAPFVGTDIANQWHGELFPNADPNHLRFSAAFNPYVADIPLVATRQEEEPLETGLLGGGYTEEYDTSESKLKSYYVIYNRETITISMHTDSAELLRCLHVIIRALVMSSLQWLITLGYDSLEYAGAGDITPAQEMLPEGQGIFMREMRWTCISQHQVAIADVTSKPAFVYLKEDGVTIGSTDEEGGVEPYQS